MSGYQSPEALLDYDPATDGDEAEWVAAQRLKGVVPVGDTPGVFVLNGRTVHRYRMAAKAPDQRS